MNSVLQNLISASKDKLSHGTLKTSCETVTEPHEVIRRIHEFAGIGWYCGTDSPIIRVRSDASQSLDIPNDSWPITAEFANGQTSLHIQRSSNGWEVCTIGEQSEPSAHSILRTSYFQSRWANPSDKKHTESKLKYRVAWQTTEDIFGQPELRPVQYRFVNFAE